jgi:5'-AMP-activated protein kinase catalytic alpha subunit
MVGYHRMPIDQTILNKLAEFNFDLDNCARCIEANKHNHITTTYYLLLKKHLRSGHTSNADISSPNFDYSAI